MVLKEFAEWLMKEQDYDRETVETLLYKKWDGAYPMSLLSDDLLVDIENFLYDLARFAVEKALKNVDSDLRFFISIVPHGSYDDASSVYVFEMETKTVLASLKGKTWYFNSEVLEGYLKDLIKQLEKSKSLLAVRLVSGS